VYSRLTLAFFHDTGWYRVNYSHGSLGRFGLNSGCTFATQSCIYRSEQDGHLHNSTAMRPFCLTNTASGSPAGPTNSVHGWCTGDRLFRAYCDFRLISPALDFNQSLPEAYQYIFGLSSAGGSSAYMDYCSSTRAYTNGDCRLGANSPSQAELVHTGQSGYTSGSRCLVSSLRRTTQEGYDRSGCFQIRCVLNSDSKRLQLLVQVQAQNSQTPVWLSCPIEGGRITAEGFFWVAGVPTR